MINVMRLISQNPLKKIQIFSINLKEQRCDASVLSSEEYYKAGRFRFECDRNTFITTRSYLRRILSDFLSQPPERLVFQFGKFSKPAVQNDQGLQFNVSHSGDFALIALTRNTEIGVDIEQIKNFDGIEKVAESYFSYEEFQYYQQQPLERRISNFYVIWTRKEAFIKCIGEGLSHPLKGFSVFSGRRVKILDETKKVDQNSSWLLQDLAVSDSYRAAFVVASESAAFDLHQL